METRDSTAPAPAATQNGVAKESIRQYVKSRGRGLFYLLALTTAAVFGAAGLLLETFTDFSWWWALPAAPPFGALAAAMLYLPVTVTRDVLGFFVHAFS